MAEIRPLSAELRHIAATELKKVGVGTGNRLGMDNAAVKGAHKK